MTKQTQRILRVFLFVSTVVSLYFVPWILVWAWILPLPDTVQEQVDDTVEFGFAGMIVYVDEAGQTPAFYTAGWKDREKKIPADPNSIFKIASISKLYVAVSIAKLVSANRLSLNKTLADYFPELKNRIEHADKITIKMMVQHRSGIPNYTDYPNYWANPRHNYQENLELILDLPAYFEPDQEYGYSNTNYLLLRELITKILGFNYQEYIKEEILKPLRLNNTYFSLEEVNIDDVMSGYYVGYNGDLKTEEQGMLATAKDVGIFLRALNDGSIFNNNEQEIYSSIYVYNHGGLIPGYQSYAEYHKDIDTVVIQFLNTTNFDGYLWNLSEIVINRIFDIIKRNHSYGT